MPYVRRTLRDECSEPEGADHAASHDLQTGECREHRQRLTQLQGSQLTCHLCVTLTPPVYTPLFMGGVGVWQVLLDLWKVWNISQNSSTMQGS